jgi:FkbM family methyltransferase
MLTPEEKIIFDKCIPYLPGKPVLFDVGAYKGAWTDYVLSRVPHALCLLFEPNDALCAELRHIYKYSLVLSDHEGTETFYRCHNKADELSSIIQREVFTQVSYNDEQKQCTTIDAFCYKDGMIADIDFLKIDVEGAELKVLKGASELLAAKRIKFIQVEYGGTYPDAGITFVDVIQFVGQFGYKVCELVGNTLVELTEDNFIEDYRFANFLITHHDIR